MRFTDSLASANMSLPPAVESWLGQQLEMRGIDAMIYSRTILSLLQQEEPDPLPLSPPIYSAARRLSVTDCATVAATKNKSRIKKLEKRRSGEFDLDEQRKMAAVKCLLSATDETSGIESFVDELYTRLREADDTKGSSANAAEKPAKPDDSLSGVGDNKATEEELQDPAQRYYAAFPALSDRCDAASSHASTPDKLWAKVAAERRGSSESEDSGRDADTKENVKPEESVNQGKTKKDKKDLYNLASKYGRKQSPEIKNQSSPLAERRRHRESRRYPHKKTPVHAIQHTSGLPGVASPKFRMYTFKGKSIEQIKGKSLFQDVEGDIAPSAPKPAMLDDSCSNRRPSSSEMILGDSFLNPSPPTFIVPMLASPSSARAEEYSGRKPLYLRHRSEISWKTEYGSSSKTNNDADELKASQQESEWNSDSENQSSIVEDLWRGTRPLEDIIPPSDGKRQPLYKRSMDSRAEVPRDSSPEKIDELVWDLVSDAGTGAAQMQEEPWMSAQAIEAVNAYSGGADQGKRLFQVGDSAEKAVATHSPVQEQEEIWSNAGFENTKVEHPVELTPECVENATVQSGILTSNSGVNMLSTLGVAEVCAADDSKACSYDTAKQPRIGDSKARSQVTEYGATEQTPPVPRLQPTEEQDEASLEAGRCCTMASFDPSAEPPALESGAHGKVKDESQIQDYAAGTDPSSPVGCESLVFTDPSEAVGDDGPPLSQSSSAVFGMDVPPNTPVNMQEKCASAGALSGCDVLGLSGLVLLAEQIKSLSQESDVDFTAPFFSQETTQERMAEWESLEIIADDEDDYLSLGDVMRQEVYANETDCAPQSPDMYSFMQLFNSFESPSVSVDIPTPLSSEDEVDAYLASEKPGPCHTEYACAMAEEKECALSDSSSFERTSPALLAAELGRAEVRKRFDVKKLDKNVKVNQEGLEKVGDYQFIVPFESEQQSETLRRAADSLVDAQGPVGMDDPWGGEDTSANCDIMNQSHVMYWDISGNQGIWSCLAGIKDIVWDNKEELWNMKENSLLEGVVLQPSPLREYFSPKAQCGRESKLWDVNVRRKVDLSSPLDQAIGLTAPGIIAPGLAAPSVEQILGQLNYASHAFHVTFIEGGLYGKEWKQLLADSSGATQIANSEKHDGDQDTAVLRPPEDKYWSCYSDGPPSDDESSVSSHSCLANAADLLPSANSAFTGFSRCGCSESPPPIHEVQSEPIISPVKHCTQGLEATYRMIQVKHLYKSDTSILRQLGLASGTDDEETKQTDTVEFSPDRHFVPITSHVPSQGQTSPAETVSDTVTVVPEEMNLESERFYGSWNSSKSYTRSSSYQLYMEGQLCEESTGGNEYFVPSFRVEKKYEKWAQTGESSPDVESGSESENCECSFTQRLLTDMKKVLDNDGGENEQITLKDLNSIIQNELCSSDYESMCPDTSGDEISDYQPSGIAELWEQAGSEPIEMTPASILEATARAERGVTKFQSIWSVGSNNDIAVIFEARGIRAGDQSGVQGDLEGGTQEDDILDAYAAAIDNFEDYLFQDKSGGEQEAEERQAETDDRRMLYSKLARRYARKKRQEPEWMRDDVLTHAHTDEDGDLMFAMDVPGSRDIPELQRLYSSDLEERWLTDDTNFSVQVPKYNKPKNKFGVSRKPCSFYMEGNCRRADCKFAHDVSKITCRFWEEGECFKGVTCPFLHGYYRESPKFKRKERVTSASLSAKQEFKLKGDDFPALSKSQKATSKRHAMWNMLQDDGDLNAVSTIENQNENISKSSSKSGDAKAIPPRPNRSKDRAKAKAKSLPIDIKFKSKSSSM